MIIDTAISAWFLGYLAFMAAFVMALLMRYLPKTVSLPAVAGLALWLTYAGVLGYLGIVASAPHGLTGPALLVVPVVAFVALFLARSPAAKQVALAVPLSILLGAQTFRVGVELFLHELWLDGMAPRMLTYAGANFDMAVGLSAPIVAWAYWRGRIGERAALAWNIVGLALLANIALRALLTAPGPLNFVHAEIPNIAIGTFPFTYIPGFFAPLALVLHVLAIRALRDRLRPRNLSVTQAA